MRLLRWTVTLGLILLVASSGRGASVTVTGSPGTPGAAGGGAGGPGDPATATSASTDASNDATATGGTGGTGGAGNPGNPVPPFFLGNGGSGGNGGAGGEANAQATVSVSTGGANAAATGGGGDGGPGGVGGPGTPGSPNGYGGQRGIGGNGTANAMASTALGPATASASGTGGLGGPAGNVLTLGAGDGHGEAHATSTNGSASATAEGRGGDGAAGPIQQVYGLQYTGAVGGAPGEGSASARADASSDATAVARAFGGGSQQFATSGNLQAAPNVSISSSVNADGANASASAEAHSTSGNATATAEATGGSAGRTDPLDARGGIGTATAVATSLTGDATSTARITSGASAAGYQGGQIASPILPGGPGQDATLVDAVSGSAAGTLTLVQEAFASGSRRTSGGGGNAVSTLHAENRGLGELVAQVTAVGGSGAGNATATVVGSAPDDSRVQTVAKATAGSNGQAIFCGIIICGVSYGQGGGANAIATSISQGEVLATSQAVGTNAAVLHAESNALSTDVAVVGAHARLDVGAGAVGNVPGISFQNEFDRTAHGIAGIEAVPTVPEPLSVRTVEAQLFGAPDADTSLWLAGNPNATAAVAHADDVLALGFLGARGGSHGAGVGSLVGLQSHGELELDLDPTGQNPNERFSIAFLDPTSVGVGLDLLDISISRNGEILFQTHVTNASELAALDDSVTELGLLHTGTDDDQIVLSYSLDLPPGTEPDTSFGLEFAMIEHAPEPGLGLLAFAGALGCLVTRRRA